MQALEHLRPMQPCRPGRAVRKEFEYVRHGTRTLIGAFNIRTGEVLADCGPTRTADDLLAFMARVAKHHPTGRGIHYLGQPQHSPWTAVA
jgi:hypothetical protein